MSNGAIKTGRVLTDFESLIQGEVEEQTTSPGEEEVTPLLSTENGISIYAEENPKQKKITEAQPRRFPKFWTSKN